MAEDKPIQKQQTAYKVRIKDILESDYVKEDGWEPSYILADSKKIGRVNIFATIVAKSQNSLLIDDGSARISIRFFQEQGTAADIGDSILLVGRLREYNNERYIVPEIIKKIDNKAWLEVRKLELRNNKTEPKLKEPVITAEAKPVETAEEFEITPIDRVYELIKKHDAGDGADIDEVLHESKDKDTEKIINGLLEKGDIFEIRKGRLKVLE
jgi:RPA family protein